MHAEWVCRNGLTVGLQPIYKRSTSLTVDCSLQSAIHSALTTRIILNIREAASQRLQDFSFDLHLSDTDLHVPRAQLSFAENLAGLHSDEDHKSESFQRRERNNSTMGTTEMVSFSTSATISHFTLPSTRHATRGRVVGLSEPDVVDRDSIRTSPDDWV